MEMNLNLQKLMAFVKTVECGSFTKAAEALNYTQSGISRMIQDLEREWNTALLERSRAGVKLTSDGVLLLPFAKTMCLEYQMLQNQIDALNELQSGLIRIGTISSVATHWLPRIIKAFQKDFPGIDYELLLGDYSEIEAWIMEGRVDCGFLIEPAHPDLESIFLGQDKLLAVLPMDHPLAELDRVPIQALCEQPFMLLDRSGRSEVKEIFSHYGIVPKVKFRTWDDYAIMSMVESGLGVSILPQLILQRVPYRIVAKELDVPAYREICLALRNRQTASHAVKRFLEYLAHRREIEGV